MTRQAVTKHLRVLDDAGARPSVMLTPTGDGRFWADATGIEPGDAVGVTVEPAQGSEQPTTDQVLVAQPTRG